MEQHREEVDMIRELDNDFVKDLAEFFKVFGDATRIRILRLLMDQEQNVGELADALDMTQSAVSHQLRVLRQNCLVRYIILWTTTMCVQFWNRVPPIFAINMAMKKIKFAAEDRFRPQKFLGNT